MSAYTEILAEITRRADEIIYREEYETLIDSCEETLDKDSVKRLVFCAYTSGSLAGSHQANEVADNLIESQKQYIETLKRHIELLKEIK